MLRFAKEECQKRHEFPGSGFSELLLLDTTVPIKKRDNVTAKVALNLNLRDFPGCKMQWVRQTHPQPTFTLRHLRFSLSPRLPPPEQHRSIQSFHRVHDSLMILSYSCPNHYQSFSSFFFLITPRQQQQLPPLSSSRPIRRFSISTFPP